jgi:hypothetical protein
VDLAHQLLRVNIALENTFPSPSVDVQDTFAWNCIKEADKESDSPVKVIFNHISEDDTLKGRALAYVSSLVFYEYLLTLFLGKVRCISIKGGVG